MGAHTDTENDNRDVKAAMVRDGFDRGTVSLYEQWQLDGDADLYASNTEAFDKISAWLADYNDAEASAAN